MRQFTNEQFIFKVAAKPSQTFTAATTDIITSAAHGMIEGDCIWVSNSGGALPTGLAASTNYYLRDVTTDTFKVSTSPNGAVVDITATGSGTHTYILKGKAIYVGDWQHVEANVYTASSSNFTLKFIASNQDGVDMNAAQSSTNRWDYVQLVRLSDEVSYNGTDGIVPAGTDVTENYEVNANGVKWVTAVISSYTTGNLNLTLRMWND